MIAKVKIARNEEVMEFPWIGTVKGIRFPNLDFVGFWSGWLSESPKTVQEFKECV
jgi:hypothetical protein